MKQYWIKKYLKGTKKEIVIAGIFTHVRPVWIGDLELELGQKIPKVYGFDLKIAIFYF